LAAPEPVTASRDPATSVDPRRDILQVDSVRSGYGRKQVLFGCGLRVGIGEVVSLLGHNGAGKTTLLRAIFGTLPVKGGQVFFEGDDITRSSATRNKRRGMSLIPSERIVFPTLSVVDNLRLGANIERSVQRRSERVEEVSEKFPILKERSHQLAGTLSGGQQRLLAIGMALMSSPKLLLLDEPSLGLAPAAVDTVFSVIGTLARENDLAVLLVEQNIRHALEASERTYVMRSGSVIGEYTSAELLSLDRTQWWSIM
jgi:branched-chain amino acid transport system ATP-binding protein